jgi:UDP-N-acetylmuramoylalanine--D-glutamate ligase
MALITTDNDWAGARVTVMGLGLFGGGAGAARFALDRGAEVTVTDLRSAHDLAASMEALSGRDVRFVLGRHEESDFVDADLVIVNPAVPRESKYVTLARDSGVPLTTEIVLFTERCRGRIIAVTGSNGKTTTTSIIGAIMSRHDPRTVVGGNLGRSLLDIADTVEPGTPVVLEVSSFQLEWLGDTRWAPDIGVITNLSPNHLDRHGTFENYVAAKRQLLAYQSPDQTAVLNFRDDRLRSMAETLPGRIVWFASPDAALPGACEIDGRIMAVPPDSTPVDIMPRDDIPIPGDHNAENVLAAVAAAFAWSAGPDAVSPAVAAEAIRGFAGVEHRLEYVRTVDGVDYFNDSIATTPESAICALRSFEPGTVVLIAGGYDKGMPFDSLGHEIAQRAAGLVVIGATAEQITLAASDSGFSGSAIHRAESLEEAVRTAVSISRPGQRVILSPACASYDQFRNFAERGQRFKNAVQAIQQTATPQY